MGGLPAVAESATAGDLVAGPAARAEGSTEEDLAGGLPAVAESSTGGDLVAGPPAREEDST